MLSRLGGARQIRLAVAAALAALVTGCSSLPGLSPVSHGPTAPLAVDQSTAQALITFYRSQHGLSAVVVDPALQRVAQRQAEAMGSADQLSHDVVGTLPRRLAHDDLDRSAAIENVSAGYATLADALSGWKRSPHHNENLLFAPMRRMGIAAVSAPATRYKTFWSLVMTN